MLKKLPAVWDAGESIKKEYPVKNPTYQKTIQDIVRIENNVVIRK